MGFFSSPPPLNDAVGVFVSPFWTIQEVGKRDYNTGLSKLADAQDTIQSALRPGESLTVIVPCIAQNTGYEGLLVVTSDRIVHVKGRRIVREIAKSDLADVRQLATHMGHFLLQLVSRKAAPFEAFAFHSGSKAGINFWEGTIQVPIATNDLMEHLVLTAQS